VGAAAKAAAARSRWNYFIFQTPAVELAAAFDAAKSGGVIVAAIAAVFTIGYVANIE